MVDHAEQVERDEPRGQAGERVAKALARAGVASRREVERLIAEGRVQLNGAVLATPAVKVGPGDILMVDGVVVDEPEGTRLWRYHKPVGLLTTHDDPGGRPTVFGALPPGLPRVISVGRLDINSEGLLLLTNDGALARALELPKNGWVRRYRARAYGLTSQERLDELKDGITVDGVVYGPIEAKLDKAKTGAGGTNVWITLSITEGKNREVRRVLEALNLKVNRLIRLAYGPFQLGTLAMGQVEEVGPRVIREQLSSVLPGLKTADRPSAKRVEDRGSRVEASQVLAQAFVGRRTRHDQSRPLLEAQTPNPEPSTPQSEPAKKVCKPGWAKPKLKPRPAHAKAAKSGPARAKSAHVDGSASGKPRPASRPRPKPSR